MPPAVAESQSDTASAEVEYADIEAGDPEGFVPEPVSEEAAGEPVRDAAGRFTAHVKDSAPLADTATETVADEPVETEVAPAPIADDFDTALLSRAETVYGISADEAREFGSPDLLKKAMAWHDRRAADWGLSQIEAIEAANKPQQQQAPQPIPPASQPQPPAQQIQSSLEKYKVELDPDAFDEDTIKQFNGLNDHYHQRLVEQDKVIQTMLQAVLSHDESLNQVTGQSQAEQQARVERDMDTWFAKLGDEWTDEFGKGSVRDLPAGSPQLLNRQKVARQMKGLMLTQPSNGQSPPSIDELADRAHGALYYQQIKERARKQLATQAGSRRGQSIARAAGRTGGKPVSNDQAAKQFVSKFMAQYDAAGEDSEDEGL